MKVRSNPWWIVHCTDGGDHTRVHTPAGWKLVLLRGSPAAVLFADDLSAVHFQLESLIADDLRLLPRAVPDIFSSL